MSSVTRSDKCSICNQKLRGKFCSECGQKATFKKTSGKDVGAALLSGFFSVERGLFGTLWDFTKSPQKVVHNYWNGFRFYYFSPGQLIFYTIFILGLHLAFVDPQLLGLKVQITGLERDISTLVSPQLLFLVLTLPLFTISTYLCFIQQQRSFAEHFIGLTYVYSYSAITCTVLADFLFLVFDVPLSTTFPLFFITLVIFNLRVFVVQKKWYIYLLMALLQIIVFLLLIATIIGIIFLLDPKTITFN